MFRQDGYTVREFCSFNFVNHYWEPKRAKSRLRLIRGVGILARAPKWRQTGQNGRHLLDIDLRRGGQ